MTTTIKRGNLGPVLDRPAPDRWLCFCPNFCRFVDHLWMFLVKSSFKNLGWINCLFWSFVQCGNIHFTLTKIMNTLISTKNRVFNSLVGPSETEKWQIFYNWSKIGTFQPKTKVWQNLLFYQHSQPLYGVLQKGNDNLEFVQCVNFENRASLKNNGTKKL